MSIEYKTDFEYILSESNGNCGNVLGKFIAYIIDWENVNYKLSKQQELDIIHYKYKNIYKFGAYGNTKRDYFIKLINEMDIMNVYNVMIYV